MKVPEKIEDINQNLFDKINATHEPMFINVVLEEHAKSLDCVSNVKKKVEKDGGKSILGWQIWQGNFIDEGEFHAVWEDLEENLIDITPKEKNGEIIYFPRILFVEDENLVYEGKQVNNVRINKSGNLLTDDFILVCETIFKFENKGQRATVYGKELEKKLNSKEIQNRDYMYRLKHNINTMLLNGLNKDSLCFCDSRKKYKNCHGYDLKKKLTEIL